MSMLGDLAFGMIDKAIAAELQKLIDEKVNSAVLNSLLSQIRPGGSSGESYLLSGTANLKITGIEVGYSATAMRKTQTRTVRLPDQARTLELDSLLKHRKAESPSTAAGNGPAAEFSLNTRLSVSGIGITKSLGGMSATVETLSFVLDASGKASSRKLR